MSQPQRVIKRGPNPFAPIAKLKNKQLSSTHSKYEKLPGRAAPLLSSASVAKAILALKEQLGSEVYTREHFGRLEEIDESLIDINVDIQRFLEELHIADNIIARFDPRIMQPLNVIYIKETGRYSSWEGQQSGTAFYLMKHFGLIAPGTKIQCKVVDDDLEVPGSDLLGEAVGNLGFRLLGGSGRKPIDAFFVHRSRVNGVRLYSSKLTEDTQSHEIQLVLENNHMYPAPATEAQGQKAQPGMVTYISGINNIAGHGAETKEIFEMGKEDLNWALRWHDTYFANEKGVDGGFILAFGRFAAEAREQDITLTQELEEDLNRHIVSAYGSPKSFHNECKSRLKKFQETNNLKSSWSDSCLTPILVIDYLVAGGKCEVPEVKGMRTYAGI
jgi:hypothetical protein